MDTGAVQEIVRAIREGSAVAADQVPVLLQAIQRQAIGDVVCAGVLLLIGVAGVWTTIVVGRRMPEDDRPLVYVFGITVGVIFLLAGWLSGVGAVRQLVAPELALLNLVT